MSDWLREVIGRIVDIRVTSLILRSKPATCNGARNSSLNF
jgi:hypothetical protein